MEQQPIVTGHDELSAGLLDNIAVSMLAELSKGQLDLLIQRLKNRVVFYLQKTGSGMGEQASGLGRRSARFTTI